jgi:hypothetical protein
MSDCCSSSSNCSSELSKVSKKQLCPQCEKNGTLLPIATVYQHLKQSWSWEPQGEHFYFCEASNCEVVYFDEHGSLIKQSEIRTPIGVKTQQANDLICYCYGVSVQAAKKDADIKSFVIGMTKQGSCACEIRNPSGRCCLKDFPKKKKV